MSETYWLTPLIFAVAALYSSVGHGGASGYLAAMALAGLPPAAMKPASLALNILVSGIGTLRFAREKLVDWRTLTPFVITSIPCAYLGGTIELPPKLYKYIVGVMLLAAAFELARSARKVHDDPTPVPFALALGIGALIGLLAGLTGTGGGIFLSPVLLFAGWTGTRLTSGVAAAFILANSVSGLAGATFTWAALPEALPVWLIAAAAGGLLGTHLGARVLPLYAVRYALSAVLVIAGAKLILT